jgi:hypothetical protein
MSTIINTPGEGGSGITTIIGTILVIAAVVAFFMYGLPAIQNSEPKDTNINVTLPVSDTSDTSPTTTP